MIGTGMRTVNSSIPRLLRRLRDEALVYGVVQVSVLIVASGNELLVEWVKNRVRNERNILSGA